MLKLNSTAKKLKCFISLLVILFMQTGQTDAQPSEIPEGLQISTVVKHTSVKNQQNTGTCWSFAATSFIESELLRKNNISIDLSEMFFVDYAYNKKADYFIRFMGKNNFNSGGQAHDVMDVVEIYGFVPNEAYTGLTGGIRELNHEELNSVLTSYLEAVAKMKQPSENWKIAFNDILNSYLGEIPGTFEYNNTSYSPKEFVSSLHFNTWDYVEITSFTHHPFYKSIVLEVPDNWSHASYLNVPLESMMKIIDHALSTGYSVCWDGDVSNPGFSHKNGLAIVPLPGANLKDPGFFDRMPEESEIHTEERQAKFDNYTTTDDHLMHIVGITTDKNGKKFYLIKNSWGRESNSYEGYLFMSENYMRLNTIAIMVNKKCVPGEILKIQK